MGVGSSTASGAATGATIGSVIPGIGTAIGAGIGAIGGLLGGLVGASQASAQAEFNQKLLEEQIRINDLLYARDIRAELGEDLVGAAARGVSQSGSVLNDAFNSAFNLQLQRVAKNYQLRVDQLQADVLGKQKSQAELLGGLKKGLDAAAVGIDALSTGGKISDAKKDAGGPVYGPPQTYGPPTPTGGINVQ